MALGKYGRILRGAIGNTVLWGVVWTASAFIVFQGLLLSGILVVAANLARRSRQALIIKIARLTFLAIFFLSVTDLLLVMMATST